jgi:putative transposase
MSDLLAFFTALWNYVRPAYAALLNMGRLVFLAAHFRTSLAAENLFLQKQLAPFQERKVKPRRADDATRQLMVAVSRLFDWHGALVVVKPEAPLRWHRKGFRLFWRCKSKPTGRPRLPSDLWDLIRKMIAENPIWGEERIATS